MKSNSRRTVITRVVIGSLIALALIYVVFLFVTTNFLGSNAVATETANRTTAYDVIKSSALVVRDEAAIKKTGSGVLVYEAADGEKVVADGVIASVYPSHDDVLKKQQIEDIESQISYLKNLSNVSSQANVGLDTVNAQLGEKLINFLSTVNSRKMDLLDDAKDDLMSSIFSKQIITGEQLNFQDKITELTKEKAALEKSSAKATGTIKTKDSGYFVSSIDGYESIFDTKKLDTVTYQQFKDAKPKKVNQDDFVGKVIRGVNWYLLCPITPEQAASIAHTNAQVTVRLPYATDAEIPAKIVSANQFADEEMSMLVLDCSYMNAPLSHIRNESAEIVINSFEGLKISKSALHDDVLEKTVTQKDGTKKKEKQRVQGVYVEYGNELVFKQVVILYSGDDYVICDESPDSEMLFNGTTVALYDKVVTEGSDLFNGKLLD